MASQYRKVIYYIRKNPKFASFLLVAPGLILLALFFSSLFFTLRASFYRYALGGLSEPTLTLENYIKFLTDPLYQKYMWDTLRLSGINAIVALLMGYPVAYFLVRSKSSKIRGTILMLIVIPNLVNYLIYMLALILMLRDHGIINETLIFLRIIREPIPLMYSEVAVLIGILIWCLPYVVLSLTGSIQSIDTALEDAAQSLGASKLQTFVKITFPLSLPGIALAALLAFVGGITSFVAPLMLGGGHVSFISNLIYNKVVVLSDYPFGSAASVILLSVSLMIMFGINKLLMRKFKVQ